MLNGGQQEQNVGIAVLGQQLAAQVLVDDSGNALVAALVLVVADDGDAAATAGDDDELVVEQVEDGVSLDDLLGIGGSDDATPAAAGILDEDLGGILAMNSLLLLGIRTIGLVGFLNAG